MTKYCAGANCNATEEGLTPHSSECQFEYMCAVKGLDTTIMSKSGEYFDPHTQEAWERWQWAWGAARMGTVPV